MRVAANQRPSDVYVEKVPFQKNTAEVRLRENVVEEAGEFFYDEYVLKVPYHPGLEEAVRKNFRDWLATGRIMERMHL